MVQVASMVNYDSTSLWKFKLLILRSIWPDIKLHTGFLLAGPPGTGKSTMINFLIELVGNLGVTVPPNHLDNRFMVANLMARNVAFISECSQLKGSLIDSVKKLQSHDVQKGEVKHVIDVFIFIFYGIPVFATNTNLADWLTDHAFRERFLVIDFFKTSLVRDTALAKKLLDNASGLVNWALTLTREELNLCTRADQFNLGLGFESSPMAKFKSKNLVFDKNALVRVDHLTSVFNGVRDSLGTHVKLLSSQTFAPALQHMALSLWNKKLTTLKGNDRPWLLSPAEVTQIILKDTSLRMVEKNRMLGNDLRVPARVSEKKGRGSRHTVICGIRFK